MSHRGTGPGCLLSQPFARTVHLDTCLGLSPGGKAHGETVSHGVSPSFRAISMISRRILHTERRLTDVLGRVHEGHHVVGSAVVGEEQRRTAVFERHHGRQVRELRSDPAGRACTGWTGSWKSCSATGSGATTP